VNRHVVDTNVPIVANGRPDRSEGSRVVSPSCRLAAVEFLERLLARGRILLDLGGDIQEEYHRYLQPRGQPGVGDQFYRHVLLSAPERVERVNLPRRDDGSYVDFPDATGLADFDPSDRKFAALARRTRAPVASGTDTDWLDHRPHLEANGINVLFVCGCEPKQWFSP
jgi:hypothetical protein